MCPADPALVPTLKLELPSPEMLSGAGDINGNTGASQSHPSQAHSQCGFGKLLLLRTVTQ